MITTCILNKYIYPGVYVFDARGMHYTYPRGMRFFPSCKLLKMLNLTHTPSPLINPPRGMCWGREEVTKLKKGRTPMATPTGMEMGGEALNLIGMEEGQVLLENAIKFGGPQTEGQLYRLWKEIARMKFDGLVAEAVLQGKLAAVWDEQAGDLKFKLAELLMRD